MIHLAETQRTVDGKVEEIRQTYSFKQCKQQYKSVGINGLVVERATRLDRRMDGGAMCRITAQLMALNKLQTTS